MCEWEQNTTGREFYQYPHGKIVVMNLRQLVFSIAAFCLVLPMLAWAQAADGGLVPCGDKGEPACQTCHVVDLMNNVTGWLVGVLSVAAAIMFVVAGYRLVTAGGNQSTMKSAKDMIVNVMIGFVIVLGAWLFIDLIMKVLIGGGAEAEIGPWNAIQCVEQPESTVIPGTIGLAVGGGITAMQCDAGPAGNTICTAQEETCRAQGGTPSVNETNVNNYTVDCALPAGSFSGGSCDVESDTNNACHPSRLGCFGGQASQASQICNLESAGGQTGVMSGSDLCRDGNSFSGGLWQVNIIAHCGRIPGCDCSAIRNVGSGAQGGCLSRRTNSRGVSYCERWNCEVSNASAYQACVNSVRNPEVNSQIACNLYDGRGGNGNFGDWLTSARACGVM